MAKTTTWSEQALTDLLNGAAFLGSGGGGPVGLGQTLLDTILKDGKPVEVVELDELPDSAWMAVSAGAGSPKAATHGFNAEVAVTAFKQLSTRRQAAEGKALEYVLPGEVGAANSLLPIYVSTRLGIPIVDAAGADRAMPTLPWATYAAAGLPASPIVLADDNETLVYEVDGARAADVAMRGIISSGTFPDDAGVAFWAMQGASAKKAAIPGTMTKARNVGELLRTAPDPAAAAAAQLNGEVLISGTITSISETAGGGFDLGFVTVTDAAENTVMIALQNESLLAWRSTCNHPIVIAPDLVCWVDGEGQAYSNADIKEGQDISVVALPAGEQMRAREILDAVSATLTGIGYPGPSTPLDQLKASCRGCRS